MGKKKKIEILMGIPCKENIEAETFLSIIKTIKTLQKMGIICDVAVSSGSLITKNRTNLVSKFLESERFTHLLFVDSDMVFEPTDVINLIKHDKLFVNGMAKVRGGAFYNFFANMGKGDNGVTQYMPLNVKNSGLVVVDGVGLAFALIKRELFDMIDYKRFEMVEGNSEDFMFCELCQKSGVDVYGDSSTIVGHKTHHVWY